MEAFKFLNRLKFKRGPICVGPGDIVTVTYYEASGTATRLISHEIQPGEGGIYDEAAVFEGIIEGRKVLGGLIMEKETADDIKAVA